MLPVKIWNSATNPESAGSPSDAKAATANSPVVRGALPARPPNRSMSYVPARSRNTPARRNRAAVTRPWLTIWVTAPETAVLRACAVPSETTPAAPTASTTYPMWLTEVYAIIRLRSRWARATSAPQSTETSPTARTTQAHARQASGISVMPRRTNPYVPSFSSTPASTADPTAGASVCAGGSQVWNGTVGVLTARPRRIAPRTTAEAVPPPEKGS